MHEFRALIQAARTAGVEDALPHLVERGLTTPLKTWDQREALNQLSMGSEEKKRFLEEISTICRPATRPQQRKDHPTLCPSKGGSLERALAAAAPNERKHSLEQLRGDIYAQSNSAPMQSRMKTWCQLAEAWGLAPMPMTAELIESMGASFKRGGYGSAHLYFAAAKKEHTMRFGSFPQDLDLKLSKTHSDRWNEASVPPS